MNEHDKALVASARQMRWEDINEDEAETVEGRSVLHDIIMHKYHYDEYKCGMI